MKKIELTQGKYALVDDEDFEWLNQMNWYVHGGYAARSKNLKNKKWFTVRMHREIIKATSEQEVDHINGDKLDNRKSNLRLCTHKQNVRNASIRRDNTSGFRGVSFIKFKTKNKVYEYWRVQISVDSKIKTIGYFKTPKEAALAYNKAAFEYHGEFAKLNHWY